MSIKSIKAYAGNPPNAGYFNGSTTFWFDTTAGTIKYFNVAGVATSLEDSGSDAIADNTVFGIGTDNDGVLYHRTTILAANTLLATVMVGTPVAPAISANSTIFSNVTADGDILIAAQTGGNSQAWVWIDSSAGLAQLLGAGVPVLEWTATKIEVPDLILFTLGTDNDQALVNKSSATNADTAITGVLVGTPVTDALAANSLIISGITASGDILVAANRGGASEQYIFIDSSAGVMYLSGLAGGIGIALSTDQPAPDNANSVHIWAGTAGVVSAVAAATIISETDQTTNALNFLGPTTTTAQGIYFGDTDNDAGSLLYSHASVETLNVTVATVAVGKWNNAGYHNIAGLLTDKKTSASVSADSNQVYTAAQVLGGIITRTGQTAGRTDAVDTAENIVTAIPGAYVGQSFFFVVNNNDASDTVTVNGASTGITYEGTATALAVGDAWLFMALLTNVTGGMEAVTVYQFAK